MRVELLFFAGCPGHDELLLRLRELLARTGADADVELREVADLEGAERERFLGSPTVRVDGEDIDPDAGERSDFGMKCRLYATPEGLRGLPPDEWVLDALARAGSAAKGTA